MAELRPGRDKSILPVAGEVAHENSSASACSLCQRVSRRLQRLVGYFYHDAGAVGRPSLPQRS